MDQITEEENHPYSPSTMTCANNMTLRKIFTGFIKANKTLFIFYLSFLAILPVKSILAPHLVGKLFTCLNSINKSNKVVGCNMGFIFFIVIAILVVLQIAYILSDFVEMKLNPRMQQYVRDLMMRHQFETHATSYKDIETGAFLSYSAKLPIVIYSFVDGWKSTFIPGIVVLFAALCYIVWKDWILGAVYSLILIVFLVSMVLTFKQCVHVALEKDEIHTTLFSRTEDVLRNMMTVMSFSNQGVELDGMNEIQDRFAKACQSTLVCSLRCKYVVIPLIVAYFVFVCYYTYRINMAGGDIVALLIIVFIVINIMFDLTGNIKDLLFKWGIIKNCMQVFNECSISRIPYNQPLRVKENELHENGITFQDVAYNYPDGSTLFKNLNLTLVFGSRTLIVGEIGSGKSTLLSMIMKYRLPQEGEIYWDATPFSEIPYSVLRNKIVLLPQTPILLNRTIYENIVYGINTHSKESVTELMESLGLGAFLRSMPEQLDTKAGVSGSRLSGGQRQIIWIIKMFLLDPEVVLLDEPTASLDEETKKIVIDLIKRVMQGRTCIMVTHDQNLLDLADRVVTMEKGSIRNESNNT